VNNLLVRLAVMKGIISGHWYYNQIKKIKKCIVQEVRKCMNIEHILPQYILL